MKPETLSGIGVMSGTSLDGIDLAFCSFTHTGSRWNYKILKADTFPYDAAFRQRLATAVESSALEYARLNVALGERIAQYINQWRIGLPEPAFIASHGHTVFHQPAAGITTQIGSGAVIAALTGIPTVCDFRTTDVALGGQGAPLVPIGDELLFGQYDACLNLGGFANISFRQEGRRVAFDIAPCNMALNSLARLLNQEYDEDGHFARSGHCIPHMLEELNHLDYYQQMPPKSLGKEWFDLQFLPILQRYQQRHTPEDCLCTVSEHICFQITNSLPFKQGTLLATGGGAFNHYLIERLSECWQGCIEVPDPLTVNYKEALIFAFLGLLRLKHKNNCLQSVTGAKLDSCGGAIFLSPSVY